MNSFESLINLIFDHKYIGLKHLYIILVLVLVFSCKNETKQPSIVNPVTLEKSEKNTYAKGFEIINNENFKVLKINNPWPKAEKSYSYALIPKEMASKITFNSDDFDGIIITPVETIVVTSTTHIPALELLGVENKSSH